MMIVSFIDQIKLKVQEADVLCCFGVDLERAEAFLY